MGLILKSRPKLRTPENYITFTYLRILNGSVGQDNVKCRITQIHDMHGILKALVYLN